MATWHVPRPSHVAIESFQPEEGPASKASTCGCRYGENRDRRDLPCCGAPSSRPRMPCCPGRVQIHSQRPLAPDSTGSKHTGALLYFNPGGCTWGADPRQHHMSRVVDLRKCQMPTQAHLGLPLHRNARQIIPKSRQLAAIF